MNGIYELADRAKATARVTARRLGPDNPHANPPNPTSVPRTTFPANPPVRRRPPSNEERICDRCDRSNAFKSWYPTPLAREDFVDTSERGCTRCMALLRAVDTLYPGWVYEGEGVFKVSFTTNKWYQLHIVTREGIPSHGYLALFVPDGTADKPVKQPSISLFYPTYS